MLNQFIIFIILSIVFINNSYCQSFSKRYDFHYQQNANYTDLSTNADTFDLPLNWDDETSNTITFPFTFKYQNVLVSTLAVGTYGDIILNGITDDYIESGHIFGINMDYESKGRGKILYETVGNAPNRIFKVEFKNVGRANDFAGNDTINFQIWLYEIDNAIEYRVGYHNVPDSAIAINASEFPPKDVVFVGLMTNEGNVLSSNFQDIYFQYVNEDENGTIEDSIEYMPNLVNDMSGITYINTSYKKFPVTGNVFRFIPKNENTGIQDNNIENNFLVYPNPSINGNFYIQFQKLKYIEKNIIIKDITGKVVSTFSTKSCLCNINLSGYGHGIYFLEIISDGKHTDVKLIY